MAATAVVSQRLTQLSDVIREALRLGMPLYAQQTAVLGSLRVKTAVGAA